MRFLAICAILVFGGTAFSYVVEPLNGELHHVEPYVFEDLINGTLETLRSLLPDPITIQSLDITFPEELADVLQGNADISNLEITGLNKFQIPYLNLAIIGTRLNFTFVLPALNINTDYKGDLVLASLIPLYGDGKANIRLEDLEIEGSAQAILTGGLAVKNLRIQLYVGSATFDIHGALDDEDFSGIISSVLNDVVASFIDNHQEALSNIISPLIESVINLILSGASTATTTAPPVE